MDKRYSYVIWLFFGILFIAIGSMALDIGDDSDCENGYGIITDEGIWKCLDLDDIFTYTNLTINNTHYNNVIINTTNATIDCINGAYYYWNESTSELTIGKCDGTEAVEINWTGNHIFVNNVTANWFFGKYNWSIDTVPSSNYLSFDGSILTFSETNLNATIEAHLQSTTFYPTSFATIYGTESGGNNIGNLSFSDNQQFNITEANGANALLFYVNYTGVSERPDFICMAHRYMGTHEIELSLWDYDSGSWELYDSITQTSSVTKDCQNIVDGQNHVSGEKIQMKLEHPQTGVQTHKLVLDYLQIVHGFGVTSTEESDPFAIHKDGSVIWEGNDNHSGYNVTDVSYYCFDNGECFSGVWTQTGDQSGLSGKKEGSFDINTTGNIITEGNITAGLGVFLDGFTTTNPDFVDVTNGDFATGDFTGWTTGGTASWSAAGNKAKASFTFPTGASSTLVPNPSLNIEAGKVYLISIKVHRTAGFITGTVTVGGETIVDIATDTTVGVETTVTKFITASNTDNLLLSANLVAPFGGNYIEYDDITVTEFASIPSNIVMSGLLDVDGNAFVHGNFGWAGQGEAVLSATTTEGLTIDGSTNPIVEDGTVTGSKIRGMTASRTVQGDIESGSASSEFQMWGNSVTVSKNADVHTSSSGPVEDVSGIRTVVSMTGAGANAFSGTLTRQEHGIENFLTYSGTQTAANSETSDVYGMKNSITYGKVLNNASATIINDVYGSYNQLSLTQAKETAGTHDTTSYGSWVSISNPSASFSNGIKTSYGFYLASILNADTAYAFYNGATAIPNLLGKDNTKSYFGTGLDAYMEWDGTNFQFNQTGNGTWTFRNSSGLGTIRYGSALTSTTVDNGTDTLEEFNLGSELYNEDGSINHTSFGKCYRQIPVRDSDNCWQVPIDFWCSETECTEENPNNETWIRETVEECGTKLEDTVDLTCEQAQQRQALAHLNTNLDLYENLTDFDTAILSEEIYTQSKTIEDGVSYIDKIKDKEKLKNKTTHYSYVDNIYGTELDGLDLEERVVVLEGAVNELFTILCNKNILKKEDGCLE